MDLSTWAPAAATALAIALAIVVLALLRRRRERRDRRAFTAAQSHGLHQPQSLHPEIDPAICIGSLACIKACPEGDILGIIDGTARLIHGAHCVGHGRCAAECPVSAIKLVFGTSQRGVDLPEIDTSFESSRPGVHIVGELGGMGLIKNAVTQGLELAEALHRRKGPLAEGAVDVAVVGSGPAGLASALALKKAGLSLRVLEQDSLGGTIAHFPRHKVVMTEPVELPYLGRLARSSLSKHELLDVWRKATEKAALKVEEGVKVVGLEGQDGDFTLATDKGPVRARKVVLATGRRGSPRKLGVPGEELEKVAYRFLEPEQYAGAKVLVVGGGDSALEAAIALCEASGAEVALSYRGPAFGKCREANRAKVEQLGKEGRLRALMSSQVQEIRPTEVSLTTPEGPLALKNDFVLALLGGELPLEFLQKMGVAVKRFHGEAPKSQAAGPGARESRLQAEEHRRRRIAFGLAVLGVLTVVLLALKGWEYYLVPISKRLRADGHATLKPAGLWGHGVGVVATLFMLSNFAYVARKRLGFLKGHSSIRLWLTFHMFVGLMSPLVILFHGAFQANNQLAAGTLLALVVVVVTGIVGRFVYGLVPAEGGAALEQADLLATLERAKAQIQAALAGTPKAEAAELLMKELGDSAPRHFIGALWRMGTLRVRLAARLRPFRAAIGDVNRFHELKTAALHLARQRVQADFARGFKRLLSGWRLFHAVLALFLVAAIAAHIGVSWFLGYRWIFR